MDCDTGLYATTLLGGVARTRLHAIARAAANAVRNRNEIEVVADNFFEGCGYAVIYVGNLTRAGTALRTPEYLGEVPQRST